MPPIKPSTISVLLRVATPVTKAPSPSRIMPIFSEGVIGQQALNVMLHQRIQSADKGGDHPQRQQHHAPPQRRHAAGQRNGQHAVQTNLHYHRGKQRGGRRAGPGVSLRRPAVQRDRPGQQGEPHQTRQPEQRVLHHIHRLKVDLRQLEGAVG